MNCPVLSDMGTKIQGLENGMENYQEGLKDFTFNKDPIAKGEELLGTDYGAAYFGKYNGSITVTQKTNTIDCSEFISYAFQTPLYRTWEFNKNTDFEKVNTLQRNDVIVWNVYSTKGEFITGHEVIYTGEGGDRALLHSSGSLGVSYSSNYVEAYYEKTYPNCRIEMTYYRKKQ